MAENMEGKTATELFTMGTKAYHLNKYSDAAACLSRSSEMFVEEHKDDKHNSLGNVYLVYGKALLEIARRDGNPLGDGVPKEVGVEEEVSDEEDGEEEMEEGEGKKEEGETKEGEETKKKDDEKTDGEKETKEDKTEDGKSANISINGEAASSTTAEAEAEDETMEAEEEGEGDDDEGLDEEATEEDAGEGGSGEKPEEEEPTDLQLAWEVLELAKIILERRGEEGKQDFADCLITLGEVSLESENFDSAISDIKSGIEIQEKLFTESKDVRKLAESYYKLGMALAANDKTEEGITYYQKTLEILKERMKVMEALAEPGSSDLQEIKEMKELIPEMEEKIEDLRVYKEEAAKSKEEDQPVVSSPEKKVNNITHLVKRKRKLEEVAEEAAESAAKKAAS